MKKFGWAYIGCGDIAQITAKEVLASGDGEIVAVWNRTEQRAQEFVKRFGGKVCATPEEAMDADGVNGVYIAVTADQHMKYMTLCIAHGKPVLCEKPFTVNASQAEEIFRLASQQRVYVAEAMWTWHNATARMVKAWVDSGFLGNIKEVNVAYSFPMIKFSKKPRHLQAELIAGALLDIGVYCIRYCYELFGMPKNIICKGRLYQGFDLGEKVTLEYQDFSVHMTIARDENDGERFEIIGENSSILVPMFHAAKRAVLRGDVSAKVKDTNLLYGTQFSNVAEEIQRGYTESRIISPKSTIDCLTILDECRDQMGLVYPCEKE